MIYIALMEIDCEKNYYKKNKDKILKQRKIYIKNNKQKIQEYNKLKRENNKTKCLCQEMVGRAKRRAKIKNINFDISFKDVFNIIPDICPYLKVPFTYFSDTKKIDYSMSLDRIDNKKGYIIGNIQIISFRANCIKNESNLFELEKLIKWIESWKQEKNNYQDVIRFYDEKLLKSLYLNKKKHGKFNLTFEEFVSLFPLNKKCPIFNFDFCFGNHRKYNSISIDKFNPNIEYEYNNISIISRKANTIKSNASLIELKQIFSAWKNHKGKGKYEVSKL